MYSSDDMSKKPRMAAPPPPANNNDAVVESDGESALPDPWSAVCIVGFRVYSKDQDLQLHIVMEGGELSENGMGEKGAADIDNAQANAGGERMEKKVDSDKKATDEVEIIDGGAVVKHKMVVDNDQKNDADAETKAEKADGDTRDGSRDQNKDAESGSDDKDDADSADCTPINTPDSTVDGNMDCTPQSRPSRSPASEGHKG
ncbi:hypothetical protein DL766_010178 [Monosporascus sp. MC13-8B]|nr:hypothetical protein DL766_010178 [Monosporascus sp. MC13-8B]